MIELTSVRLERPRVTAPLLDGADLQVGRGEVVVVTAPAGAGTSTLIDAVLGETLPRAGNVTVFGRDLSRLRHSSLLAMRRRFGVVPQRLELLLERTALANVSLPLEIDHLPRRQIAARAAAWLDRVGVDADRLVGELSLAEQQRVALARALVREPRVVVADQPTAHQDAAGAERVATLLADAADRGAAVLVASRDPHLGAFARRRGWRHIAIDGSRLVARTGAGEAHPAEVRDPASAEITIEVDVDDSGTVVMVPKVLPFPVTARSRGVG